MSVGRNRYGQPRQSPRSAEWLKHLGVQLDELAATTWHKVEVGPDRGLIFGEESITDHNLFELDYRCPEIEVYKFKHREEARNGADFEWYIGGRSAGWIGMRFQAKKLDDGHYLQLGHRTRGRRQYDVLLQSARVDSMWPFYCFYNGWSGAWPDGVLNLTCPKCLYPRRLALEGGCTHAKLEQFGCAIAPAERVALRHRAEPRAGRLTLDDYLSLSRPWSHLFTSELKRQTGATTTSILDDLTRRLESWFRPNDGDHAESKQDARPANYPPRLERLPGWLEAVRDGERFSESRSAPPRVAVVLDADFTIG